MRTIRAMAAAVMVFLGLGGAAYAQPFNEGPPPGAILDLNGGIIPHGATPQQYTVDFTATQSSTFLTFAFREDPAFITFTNPSVAPLSNLSNNLLLNSSFAGGVYTENGNSSVPVDWSFLNQYGATYQGVVDFNGSNYYWYDGSVQAYDAISQAITTTVGQQYQVTFDATDNSALTNWSRLSTNGDITNTGGNGADILVYATAQVLNLNAVPEPAALAVFAAALVTLAATRRRCRT